MGKKVKSVLSSKFCTGRHLQLFNETMKLLEEIDEEDGAASKKRKVEKQKKMRKGVRMGTRHEAKT